MSRPADALGQLRDEVLCRKVLPLDGPRPRGLAMKPLLHEYEHKRARARHHFQALHEATDEFANRARDAVRGEFDGGAGRYVFRVPLEPIDPHWTLLLGDRVYNARAGLDHLITALIRSAGTRKTKPASFRSSASSEEDGKRSMSGGRNRR